MTRDSDLASQPSDVSTRVSHVLCHDSSKRLSCDAHKHDEDECVEENEAYREPPVWHGLRSMPLIYLHAFRIANVTASPCFGSEGDFLALKFDTYAGCFVGCGAIKAGCFVASLIIRT